MLAARLIDRSRLGRVATDPHAVLAVALGIALACDHVLRAYSYSWYVVLAGLAAVAAGLLNAWRQQDRLRLPAVLAVTLAFQLGLVLLHVATDVHADWDSREVYGPQGQALLDGDYPPSEYPLGAVLLFALEALLGDGNAERPNALLMIPFQLLLVASIWRVGPRLAPWLATAVGVWPANVFWWEFRYDLVPAALLALGLLLALRQRWGWAGLALGIGAFFKWTPGLAVVALTAWLLVNRRWREVQRFLVGTVLVVLVHVPFAVVAGDDLAAAYTNQGSRSITAESIWYLPLHVFGVVEFPAHVSSEAGAPKLADDLAIVIQGLWLLALVTLTATVRTLRPAVALAAMLPVAFFVTNRIFSPQFVLVMFAAWAVAFALLARSRREQLALGAAMLAVASLNIFVYPFSLPAQDVTWEVCSLGLFAIALAITGWVVVRALRADGGELATSRADLGPACRQ
jgi:hypothetical protein